MASRKLLDEERKVCLEFDRFIDEYEFELLFDVEDIEAAIVECRKLLESYIWRCIENWKMNMKNL